MSSSRITIVDITLRDGAQAPGLAPRLDEQAEAGAVPSREPVQEVAVS